MMKNLSQEKGQAIVLFALAAIGLIAFAALAIDGGRVFSDRRHAQNAADSAALAVALSLARAPEGADYLQIATDAATESAAINGYVDKNEVTNDVIVKLTEARDARRECNGAYHGTDAQVTIVSTIDTTLARVIGRNQVTNRVSAWARFCHPVIDINTGTVLQPGSVTMLK